MADRVWDIEVTALALTTPIDRIRFNELGSSQLAQLLELIEDMHRDPARGDARFEQRYWQIRRLFEENDRD